MFEGLSPAHLIFVLAIALLVIGPGKLPETGAALGKGIREFRRSLSDPVEPAPAIARGPVTDTAAPGGAGETESERPDRP